MQVDLAIVFSVASAVGTGVWGVIAWLGKANVKQHEDAIDVRFEAVLTKHNELGARLGGRIDTTEAEVRALTERAHQAELIRVKLEGELALLKQTGADHHHDLELIQEKMVTRAEWETRLKSLEEMVKQVLIEVRTVARSGPTRYSSSQTPAPTGLPPRPDRVR